MRSKLPLLIVLAALFVFAAFAFLGIRHRIAQINALLPVVLRTELQTRLKRQVSLHSFEIIRPGTAVITDLGIGERASFGGGAFFTCPRVVVRFNLLDVLLAREPIARAVTSITLVEPSVRVVRNPSGEFSAQDLISPPPVPAEQRFRGLIRVYSGSVTMVDYAAKVHPLPATNTLHNVHMTLDFRPDDFLRLDVRSAGPQGRLVRFTASGRLGVSSRKTDIRVRITDASAAYWTAYFSDVSELRIASGRLNATADLRSLPNGKIVATGSARLSGASLQSPYLNSPISQFGADAGFSPGGVTLYGRGLLRRSPLKVLGRLTGIPPTSVNLTIASDRMDFASLRNAIITGKPIPIRIAGVGPLGVRVTGDVTNPRIELAADIPRAELNGVRATSIRIRASSRFGRYQVSRLTGQVAGGSFDVTGGGTTSPLSFRGRGFVSNVNLALIPRSGLAGRADAGFGLTYARGSPSVRGTVNLVGLRVGGRSFSSASVALTYTQARADVSIRVGPARLTPHVGMTSATGRVFLRGKTILVKQIAVETSAGDLLVSGSATMGGALSLDLRATGVDLSALRVTSKDIAGKAALHGRLSGSFGDPRFTGRAEITDIAFGRLRATSAVADLLASRSDILIRNPSIHGDGWSVIGTGDIRLTTAGPPVLDLIVRVKHIDLACFDEALGTKLDVAGILNADVHLASSPPGLRVSGHASVDKLSVHGVEFDRARIVADSTAAGIAIQEITFERGEMSIDGRGTVSRDGALDIAFDGRSLDLSILNDSAKPYLTLAGPLTFGALIGGTTVAPRVEIRISANSPKLNGIEFDSLSASASWDGAQFVISHASLLKGASVYAVKSASFALSDSRYAVSAAISKGNVADIIAVLKDSPAIGKPEGESLQSTLAMIPMPATGDLEMSLNASRTPDTGFALTGDLIGTDVSLANKQIGDVVANVKAAGDIVTVERLDIAGPYGQLTIHGTIGPDEKIALTGETKAMSLEILKPWVPDNRARGLLDLAFTLGGTLSEPEMKGKLTATGVDAGDFCATSISSPEFAIAKGRLSSERITILQDGSEGVISGYLPFAWEPPFIQKDQPFEAKLAVQNQDLSILKCFTKDITVANGRLDISATASGTLNDPVFAGHLTVSDGSIALSPFRNSFTRIALSASLEGSTLKIESLTGASSLGGTFSGGGAVSLVGKPRTIQAFLDLMSLRLSIGGSFQIPDFTASGHLTASDSLESLLIQGNVVITDAKISLAAKEIPTSITVPPMPISPQLDVTIDLARDVVVERGALKAEIAGPLHLTGVLPNPILSGTLRIVSGGLSFPARSITFAPNSTVSIYLRPPGPPVITVNVSLMTMVTATSAFFGRIGRYRVFMDISGPIGDLAINLRSSPPGLSGVDALANVLGGPALEGILRGEPDQALLQQQLGQLLLGFAVPGIFEPISLGGGVSVGITPGIFAPIELNAAAFLSDRVVLTYTQSLVGGMPYSVFALNYALSDQLSTAIQFQGPYWTPDEATILLQYYKAY